LDGFVPRLRSLARQRPIHVLISPELDHFFPKQASSYRPAISGEANRFLSRANEAWRLGLDLGAIILVLLATEHVFRYYYEKLVVGPYVEENTWGQNLTILEAHEVPDVLLRKLRTTVEYRNRIMHGESDDYEVQEGLLADSAATYAIEDAELEDEIDLPPDIKLLDAPNIWAHCCEVTREMLNHLEVEGKTYAPDEGWEEINELLEFADLNMGYSHRGTKQKINCLPREITCATAISGLKPWPPVEKRQPFQSLRDLSLEQLEARVNWCIEMRLFEHGDRSTDNGTKIGVVYLAQAGKKRLNKLWKDRFLAYLKSWGPDSPDPEEWQTFHELHFSIKVEVLRQIRGYPESEWRPCLEKWRELAQQDGPKGNPQGGWKRIVHEIDRTLETLKPEQQCTSSTSLTP
jgi:hypothetical protein